MLELPGFGIRDAGFGIRQSRSRLLCVIGAWGLLHHGETPLRGGLMFLDGKLQAPERIGTLADTEGHLRVLPLAACRILGWHGCHASSAHAAPRRETARRFATESSQPSRVLP
ncbi:hypothetical protein FLG15_14425 [Xanthomonas phaseoli pv. dieffenbachiae]